MMLMFHSQALSMPSELSPLNYSVGKCFKCIVYQAKGFICFLLSTKNPFIFTFHFSYLVFCTVYLCFQIEIAMIRCF